MIKLFGLVFFLVIEENAVVHAVRPHHIVGIVADEVGDSFGTVTSN